MSYIKRHKVISCLVVILFGLIAAIFISRRMSIMEFHSDGTIVVTSSAFEDGGVIPVKHTGKGEDISPELILSEISPKAKSIAVMMDDLDFPFGVYNHWVMWNLPVQNFVPEGVEPGAIVDSLGGAIQGKGYGKHRYKGPNPPFGTHRYQYSVFVLDCTLDLSSDSGKKELMKSMEGHILQYGSITGKYR